MNDLSLRLPVAAGSFYPSRPDILRAALRDAFHDPAGPGPIAPSDLHATRLLALMAPHAGYRYSGTVAAHAFASLAKEARPGGVLILGPNHGGCGAALAVPESRMWRTPLGDIPVDMDLRDAVLEADCGVEADEEPFVQEHSQEVMLPFLQYLFDPPLPILPMAWGRKPLYSAIPLGERLAPLLWGNGRRIVLLASSDLSHYVPDRIARVRDRLATACVARVDAPELIETVVRQNLTMCGPGPVAAALAAVASVHGHGELLAYATSGDATHDWKSVVGYASAAFYRKES